MNKKNYYEILGVAPHVGSGQIQAAYRFTRSLYSGESTPTYGLLDAEERAEMLGLVEEAYSVLGNPSARRDYDLQAAGAGPAPAVIEAHQPPPSPPRPHRDEPRSQVPAEQAAAAAPVAQPPNPEPVKVPEQVNGAVLRALRESRHLSIDQIAALSKVGSRFLRALEEDRHEALPGRVFARGFLIEYARAIRASETELVERYLRHWPVK